MSQLTVSGLDAFHGRARALSDFSITVRGGEILCLLGRNGAGKTTALRAIMGTVRRGQGSIMLDDRDLSALPPEAIPRAGIAHVPQGRRLFAELTVAENLQIGLATRNSPRAVLERALALFPVLGERLQQRSGTLSGGEQTMLAVARAICVDPQVILLDEPTEGLMPQAVATIRDALRQLRAAGVAVLLVEQRAAAVLDLADRAVFLEHGRIAAQTDAAALQADPSLLHRYLGV